MEEIEVSGEITKEPGPGAGTKVSGGIAEGPGVDTGVMSISPSVSKSRSNKGLFKSILLSSSCLVDRVSIGSGIRGDQLA